MKSKPVLAALPYLPKLWASIVYFVLLLSALVLFMGRSYKALRPDLLLRLLPDFYSHASNLCLSFMIYLVAGYVSILFTQNLRIAVLIGLFLLIANFIVEWFVPVMNVPDPTDAYYGFAGTLLPFFFFVCYLRYGVVRNPGFGEKKETL